MLLLHIDLRSHINNDRTHIGCYHVIYITEILPYWPCPHPHHNQICLFKTMTATEATPPTSSNNRLIFYSENEDRRQPGSPTQWEGRIQRGCFYIMPGTKWSCLVILSFGWAWDALFALDIDAIKVYGTSEVYRKCPLMKVSREKKEITGRVHGRQRWRVKRWGKEKLFGYPFLFTQMARVCGGLRVRNVTGVFQHVQSAFLIRQVACLSM